MSAPGGLGEASISGTARRYRGVPTWLLLGGLAALVGLLKTGIGTWTGWDNLLHVAANWDGPQGSVILEPGQDYFLPNAGFSALLGALGISTQGAWLTVHVMLAVIAVMLPFTFRAFRASMDRQRLLFIVLAGGPLVTVLFAWIGSYDAVCVIGATVASLSRTRRAQWVGWALYAFGHWQLALVSAGVLVAYRVLASPDRGNWKLALSTAITAGLGIAPVALLISIIVNDWGGTTSRWELLTRAPLDFAYSLLSAMPGLVFTVLGVVWLVILRPSTLRESSARALVIVTIAATLVLPLVAVDQTRIVSIALVPVVLAWVHEALDRYPVELVRGWWHSTWVAVLIVPVPMYVNGTPVLPGWLSFLSWRAGLGG